MYYSVILLVSAISAAAAASLSPGQVISTNALDRIMGRQTRICSPVSTPSCSLSCGAGFVTCVAWPNCYNPGRGDTCCSNGSYCRTGYYCTDVGCCPNGSTLAECGATSSLSVVPPPVADPTSSPSSSSSTTRFSSISTITPPYPSSSSSSSAASSSSSSRTTTTTTTTTSPTATRAPNGTTTTTSSTLRVTNAAQTAGVGAAQMAIGGLGLLLLL